LDANKAEPSCRANFTHVLAILPATEVAASTWWSGVTFSVTGTSDWRHSTSWVGYNWCVPKPNCTSRADWRLQTGKPAEALSAHYRLDCDYGTAVIVCWQQGGSEPIYVCESHAKQLGRSREHGPEARVLTAPDAEQSNKPGKRDVRTKSQEVAVPKRNGREARVPTAPQAAESSKPVKREERTQVQEVAVVVANGSAPPVAARSRAIKKIGRVADASVRAPVREQTYGNSAKAMVDEAIWNLAPGDQQVFQAALQQGKSANEAAEAAGGQLAVIHRKIGEYTGKLEAVLSESKARIHVGEAVDKPLDQRVLEIISDGTKSDLEKDSAIQQLGAIQEWVKQGLKGEITPMQANGILLAIGDRLNWGGATGVLEEFKPVYRTIYITLKTAIHSAVPEAQELHDRLTNLYAAKAEMENG
jgi:hypothetical protein